MIDSRELESRWYLENDNSIKPQPNMWRIVSYNAKNRRQLDGSTVRPEYLATVYSKEIAEDIVDLHNCKWDQNCFSKSEPKDDGMKKPQVIQLDNGEWAVVLSTHPTKGAADKAANVYKNQEDLETNTCSLKVDEANKKVIVMRLAEEFKKIADDSDVKKKEIWTKVILNMVEPFRVSAKKGEYSAKFYLPKDIPSLFTLTLLQDHGFVTQIGVEEDRVWSTVYAVTIIWSEIYYVRDHQ